MDKQLNEYTPDLVSAPGETLLEILEDRGMTQAELAERTGRPRKTINEIIKGKSAITPETALQLERALAVDASFWNHLEGNYRAWLARENERHKLSQQLEWLASIPWRAMLKKGWIEERSDRVEQMREILTFFGVATPKAFESSLTRAAFRKSKAFESDGLSLAAWLRKGEVEGTKIHCQGWNKAGFNKALETIRELTLSPLPQSFPQLREICASVGVAVVIVDTLPKTHVQGATRWLSPNRALIQMTIRYRREDIFWFSFFHEAAHIMLHGKRDLFLNGAEENRQAEDEADRFAALTLIADDDMQRLRQVSRFSQPLIIEASQRFGIAPGIIVGRLQHEDLVRMTQFKDLMRKIDRDAMAAFVA